MVIRMTSSSCVCVYAGCGHCKNLTPEFEKAADQLKGVVNFIAVNADDHRDIAAPYGIQGFPTLKIFKVR